MNKKVIAIAAALAVVLTSMAVAVPSMQSTDAAFSSVTAAPVAYGEGNGVRAILYQDKVLMLDISEVATLDKGNMYTVEVSTVKTYDDVNVEGISISHIASVAGKIVINVDGESGDKYVSLITTTTETEAQTASLYVTVKNSSNTVVGNQITLIYKITKDGLRPMTLNLYKNNDDGWDVDSIGSTATKTVSNCDLQNRGIKVGLNKTQKTIQDMTATIDTSSESDSNHTLTDPNGKLTLIGWSNEKQGVNGSVDVEAKEMIVEDLLYEAGDAGAITDTNLIELYAVYSANNYAVYIQDSFNDNKPWVTSDVVLKSTTNVGEKVSNSVKIATAYATPNISSIGYGILNIELENIPNNKNVYTFDVELYCKDTEGEVIKASTNIAKITPISTNVYKISEVKSDLYVKITVNATTSTTGTLYFDSVKNVIYNSKYCGEANLSLDLLTTTKLVSGSSLKIDGTIYKESADYIRTYSSLANYMTFSDVKTNPISVKMDGTTCTESGRISDVTLTLYETDSFTEADNYDMSLELAGGYSIYALQGIWTNGTDVMKTPWALADN